MEAACWSTKVNCSGVRREKDITRAACARARRPQYRKDEEEGGISRHETFGIFDPAGVGV